MRRRRLRPHLGAAVASATRWACIWPPGICCSPNGSCRRTGSSATSTTCSSDSREELGMGAYCAWAVPGHASPDSGARSPEGGAVTGPRGCSVGSRTICSLTSPRSGPTRGRLTRSRGSRQRAGGRCRARPTSDSASRISCGYTPRPEIARPARVPPAGRRDRRRGREQARPRSLDLGGSVCLEVVVPGLRPWRGLSGSEMTRCPAASAMHTRFSNVG